MVDIPSDMRGKVTLPTPDAVCTCNRGCPLPWDPHWCNCPCSLLYANWLEWQTQRTPIPTETQEVVEALREAKKSLGIGMLRAIPDVKTASALIDAAISRLTPTDGVTK